VFCKNEKNKKAAIKTAVKYIINLMFKFFSCIASTSKEIDRYVPRKPRLVGGDESARNEISILIAGMPRAVRGQHHCLEMQL
jgi:hypothetical protein